jgi:hypothetical protein
MRQYQVDDINFSKDIHSNSMMAQCLKDRLNHLQKHELKFELKQILETNLGYRIVYTREGGAL